MANRGPIWLDETKRWKWMEEVPRRAVPRAHPLRPLVYACFSRSGKKAAFGFPGATRDRFCCTVESLPGHIWCRAKSTSASWRKRPPKKAKWTKSAPKIGKTCLLCSAPAQGQRLQLKQTSDATSLSRGGKSTRNKKFIWTSFSEQFPLGSWLVSQGKTQKFARTFRKSSGKRGVFLVFRDFGWVSRPLIIALVLSGFWLPQWKRYFGCGIQSSQRWRQKLSLSPFAGLLSVSFPSFIRGSRNSPQTQVVKRLWLGTSPPLTEVSRALQARNPKKVSKMSPGAGGPGTPKKSQKKSRGSLRRVSGKCLESVFSGRTETLQTVTLQVKILWFFCAGKFRRKG